MNSQFGFACVCSFDFKLASSQPVSLLTFTLPIHFHILTWGEVSKWLCGAGVNHDMQFHLPYFNLPSISTWLSNSRAHVRSITTVFIGSPHSSWVSNLMLAVAWFWNKLHKWAVSYIADGKVKVCSSLLILICKLSYYITQAFLPPVKLYYNDSKVDKKALSNPPKYL